MNITWTKTFSSADDGLILTGTHLSVIQSDIGTALTQIRLVTVEASAPTGAQEGDLWYDTTNNMLSSYDGVNWTAPNTTGGPVHLTSSAYVFTTFGVTVVPTVGATYTNNGVTYTVVTATSTVIYATGISAPEASGSLIKTAGTGDNTITFSLVTGQLPAVDGSALTGLVPVGAVMPYGGSSAPTGYLICNGATVSQTTYAALYAVIAHTYGADPGGGNFILPNLKGRVPIGVGQGSTYANGVDAAGTDFALAAASGREKHKLITSEMPAHTHGIWQLSGTDIAWGFNAYGVGTGVNTTSTGGDGAHNTLQPYLVLNYIIKT